MKVLSDTAAPSALLATLGKCLLAEGVVASRLIGAVFAVDEIVAHERMVDAVIVFAPEFVLTTPAFPVCKQKSLSKILISSMN